MTVAYDNHDKIVPLKGQPGGKSSMKEWWHVVGVTNIIKTSCISSRSCFLSLAFELEPFIIRMNKETALYNKRCTSYVLVPLDTCNKRSTRPIS